tara:strand:+ start:423 stop:662 length:240 start_codon:yes stop_codon:yes gene_type:complete
MSNLDKFEEVLRETLRCSKEDLKDENGPNEIVNWDSISHMEMTSKLEEKFDIELDVDEINQIETIGAIKDTLNKHKIIL